MRRPASLPGQARDRVVAGPLRRHHPHRAGSRQPAAGRAAPSTTSTTSGIQRIRTVPSAIFPAAMPRPRLSRHRAAPRRRAGVSPSGSSVMPSGRPAARVRRAAGRAAPARSRHQPSGREPTTFAPSTMMVSGVSSARSWCQCAARPGCRSSHATCGAGHPGDLVGLVVLGIDSERASAASRQHRRVRPATVIVGEDAAQADRSRAARRTPPRLPAARPRAPTRGCRARRRAAPRCRRGGSTRSGAAAAPGRRSRRREVRPRRSGPSAGGRARTGPSRSRPG